MVIFEKIGAPDTGTIKNLLFNHYKYTQSPKAKHILDNFHKYADLFVKVMPLEYKRILEESEVTSAEGGSACGGKKADLGEYTDG